MRLLLVAVPVALLALAAVSPAAAQKVDVEMFVMSKCPDAATCQSAFAPALHALSNIINFNIRYIATVVNRTGEVQCPHGTGECEGNMQQLCARSVGETRAHLADARRRNQLPSWFDFVLCQSENMYSIPKNGQSCAQKTNLPWSAISQCVSGGEGEALLKESVTHLQTKDDRTSCTLNLNSKFWCQHNGGWERCSEGNTSQALIAAVCKRYEGQGTPAVCSNFLQRHESLQASTLTAEQQQYAADPIHAAMRHSAAPAHAPRLRQNSQAVALE